MRVISKPDVTAHVMGRHWDGYAVGPGAGKRMIHRRDVCLRWISAAQLISLRYVLWGGGGGGWGGGGGGGVGIFFSSHPTPAHTHSVLPPPPPPAPRRCIKTGFSTATMCASGDVVQPISPVTVLRGRRRRRMRPRALWDCRGCADRAPNPLPPPHVRGQGKPLCGCTPLERSRTEAGTPPPHPPPVIPPPPPQPPPDTPSHTSAAGCPPPPPPQPPPVTLPHTTTVGEPPPPSTTTASHPLTHNRCRVLPVERHP